jgi:hypothetical protein
MRAELQNLGVAQFQASISNLRWRRSPAPNFSDRVSFRGWVSFWAQLELLSRTLLTPLHAARNCHLARRPGILDQTQLNSKDRK